MKNRRCIGIRGLGRVIREIEKLPHFKSYNIGHAVYDTPYESSGCRDYCTAWIHLNSISPYGKSVFNADGRSELESLTKVLNIAKNCLDSYNQ